MLFRSQLPEAHRALQSSHSLSSQIPHDAWHGPKKKRRKETSQEESKRGVRDSEIQAGKLKKKWAKEREENTHVHTHGHTQSHSTHTVTHTKDRPGEELEDTGSASSQEGPSHSARPLMTTRSPSEAPTCCSLVSPDDVTTGCSLCLLGTQPK